MTSGDYFENHKRKDRFPWLLYHRALTRPIARVIARYGPRPKVLIVGCGLEPTIEGAQAGTDFYGCDVDERAIEACRTLVPSTADHYAVCPSEYELPCEAGFEGPFDVVVAKEVVEHVLEPTRWAAALSERVKIGGALLLSTPNYGRLSTLPLIEATVLEWVARRQGFSREHIHPTKFDRARLSALDVGRGMELRRVITTLTGWSLLAEWRRVT